MRISALRIDDRIQAFRHAAVAALVVTCSLCASAALAQIHGQQIERQPTLRPVVPLSPPRPAEGDEPAEQWQLDREQAPIASFVDSIKGNDAALQVIVGEGRLLTLKSKIAGPEGTAVIAVGDPTVVDFDVLPNPQMVRLTGLRAGMTDLSITLANGETYTVQIHVTYDLELLAARLRQMFPDARVKLGQLRDHVVVEGQARTAVQVTQIIEMVEAYVDSVQVSRRSQSRTTSGGGAPRSVPAPGPPAEGEEQEPYVQAGAERGSRSTGRVSAPSARVINLLRVPGTQQVMLQVKIAEVDRTALREIGADLLFLSTSSGDFLNTMIGGVNATVVGRFSNGDFRILLDALRRNTVIKVLAEPNLITMNGHQASFLSGGEFPYQVLNTLGVGNTQFKEFGVRVGFLPFILDDGRIRLHVEPEVSTIDLETTLLTAGTAPALRARRAATTVELREGETLAIAGLIESQTDGGTDRIPFIGDLPYIGPFFSSTSHVRRDRELLIMVTPYLVDGMQPGEVPALPGSDMKDPNDIEFYLFNRIESCSCGDYRATANHDCPSCREKRCGLEKKCLHGPVGFSD